MSIQKISLPEKIKIEEDKENKNQAMITIEPLYPGYGITIGNALRRVLLSSLPGAAVTAFKIKGVQHEFSTVPGIIEDAVEITMNLKQLHLKVFSDEPIELSLNAKGEKIVKASDIEKNADVEIANPDLAICHLTSKNANLEMKIWVEPGLGYVPVEERKGEKSEIGVIQVDAVYSPVLKVGFKTENIRVGERTDYDKLILDVETDGTIIPAEALKKATGILVEQFNFVLESGQDGVVRQDEKTGGARGQKEEAEAADKNVKKKVEEEPAIVESSAETEFDQGPEPKAEVEKPKRKRGRPKKTEVK